MSEANLSKKIGLTIRKRGGWARKTHGGPTMAGWPDVVAVYRGVALWLEVKLPGKEKTLTKLQAAVLAEAKAAGAVARMVTTVDQVVAILDAIDRRRDEHREGKAHKSRTRSGASRTAKRARNAGRDA